MRDAIRRFLARNRRQRLVAKLGRSLGYYFQGFENIDYNQATNGEKFVLECLARTYPLARVFDVGAHHGDWARLAAAILPQGRIDSFEVIPETFARLRENVAARSNVTVHQVGLAEADGTLEFAVAAGRDDLTSGLAGVHGEMHRFDYRKVACPVLTGDRFCAENGVERIDFLKLDVEGLEPSVLRGCASLLRAGRIRMIQFEYGQLNLQARFFLRDFHDLLEPHGMTIGKIYPNYVEFRSYHFTQDNLSGPNFLAVRRDETELRRLLAG